MEFRGEYSFLSNFHPVQVQLNFPGVMIPEEVLPYEFTFRTIEHAYQAAKFFDRIVRQTVRSAKTPALAKKIGRGYPDLLRPDWENVKVYVMRHLLMQKFIQEPFHSKLLATNNASLVEGNWWGDTFWGVCRGFGDNVLGILLMELRDSLRQGVCEHVS